MKCVYVCSPPNLELAKQLCIAVLEEGNAPFSPHLSYSGFAYSGLLKKASFAWLGQASEVWVYAKDLEECSESMRLELAQAEKFNIQPKVVFMPECFRGVNVPGVKPLEVAEYGPAP